MSRNTDIANIALVVGTCNRIDQLQALVESVRRDVATPWRLYVSDAGSKDGTVEWLRAEATRDARIQPIFEGRRLGQAAALNKVFKTLSSDFACWLSDDNILVNGGLDTAIAGLRADDRLGIVGLKVRDIRGPFSTSPYIGGITSAGVLNINQGVMPTNLLQALGGFDEELRDYGIDADLTTRVLIAGYDVALTRRVAIEHHRNWPEAGTSQADELETRNVLYRQRYAATYRTKFGAGLVWRSMRLLWKIARLALPRTLALDNPEPVGGFLVRDWHNMLAGRFIHLGKERALRETPLYLRQESPLREPLV